MSTSALRSKVKKAVDTLSEDKLLTVADFVRYIGGHAQDLESLLKIARMEVRLARSRRDFAEGKGVNWRKVQRHA